MAGLLRALDDLGAPNASRGHGDSTIARLIRYDRFDR
jgi:hypothetical protein